MFNKLDLSFIKKIIHFCAQVEADAALQQDEHTNSCTLQRTYELCTTSGTDESTGNTGVYFCSEEGATSEEVMENLDEDDLPTKQTFERSKPSPLPVLRELDQDGNEVIISDHRTSAGFTFRNTLMFELD